MHFETLVVYKIHIHCHATKLMQHLLWIFNPRPLRPKGYCRHLRLSVCPSVLLSVCPRKHRVSLQLMTSCYMNFAIIIQWIYFTIWRKIKKNHHHYNTILSLYNIISRHYKKSLLRSHKYHGHEELSMDTNYPTWRRQERRSKYAVQLASWQLRSNSPKMSVCLSVPIILVNTVTQSVYQINPALVGWL